MRLQVPLDLNIRHLRNCSRKLGTCSDCFYFSCGNCKTLAQLDHVKFPSPHPFRAKLIQKKIVRLWGCTLMKELGVEGGVWSAFWSNKMCLYISGLNGREDFPILVG